MWTLKTWRKLVKTPVIGMVHLRPLPSSPGWAGDLGAVEDAALRDAEALATGGVGALLLENYGDIPFVKTGVEPVTVAAMSRIAAALRRRWPELPLGVNVLRNDALSALGVAVAAGASFIRVNILAGAAVTDQGLIEGQAAALLRKRAALGADIGIMADVRVKHAAPLAARPLVTEAEDLRQRAGADALILSGVATGAPVDPDRPQLLRAALSDCPLVIGSGLTAANVSFYAEYADLFIVGTSLKITGADGLPAVDAERVTEFVQALDGARAAAAGKEAK